MCEPTGATVTLLIEAIRRQAIAISPDEATILCLGLYKDTGSIYLPVDDRARFNSRRLYCGFEAPT